MIVIGLSIASHDAALDNNLRISQLPDPNPAASFWQFTSGPHGIFDATSASWQLNVRVPWNIQSCCHLLAIDCRNSQAVLCAVEVLHISFLLLDCSLCFSPLVGLLRNWALWKKGTFSVLFFVCSSFDANFLQAGLT